MKLKGYFLPLLIVLCIFLSTQKVCSGTYSQQYPADNQTRYQIALDTTVYSALTFHNTGDRMKLDMINQLPWHVRISTCLSPAATSYTILMSSSTECEKMYRKALYGLIDGTNTATHNISVIETW